jgi:hypothetical protein
MTAIGQGLSNASYRPVKPPPIWTLIDPRDNFTACRWLMSEEDGPILPFLFPLIHELKASDDTPKQLLKISDYVQYFEIKQEELPDLGTRLEELEEERESLYKNFCMLFYSYCIGYRKYN